MRIPLDYYRVLSVPVKATAEQLKQAYQDRLRQQPRREYSDRAIKARQESIQHSYQVLSDLKQRAAYDAQFLVNMQPIEASKPPEGSAVEAKSEEVIESTVLVANSTIEIPSSQIVGALLILHELGEYETVLKIGIDYFNQQYQEQSPSDKISPGSTQEDLILTLALAYLELGREQWHRQEYENAAISGQMGIELLERWSLFPHLKEELELDLHKLRPYRILTLISQNKAKSARRKQGFQLLQSMLMQRQGIKGSYDRSGLSFEQFVSFIQQLRTYLTSAEQQQLFDNESQDSAIANYLAVYTLLARGFCLKQPELIIRAQRKLDSLGEKQDVSWEQAVSALLLGHTEKAIYQLKKAPDTFKLEQIQQYRANGGDLDLLPGLCFYGEKWLLEDVVAQFDDLSPTQLTLKDYFAEPEVQAYLEELAPPKAYAQTTSNAMVEPESSSQQTEVVKTGFLSRWRRLFSPDKSKSARIDSSKTLKNQRELATVGSTINSRSTPVASTAIEGNGKIPANPQKTIYRPAPQSHQPNHQVKKSPTLPLQPQAKTRAVPASVMQKTQGKIKQRRAKNKRSLPTLNKGWLLIFGSLLGVGTISLVAAKLFLSPSPEANEALAVALSQPAVDLPPKKVQTVAAKPNSTFPERSQQVIQTWLNSKSAAFGKEHQIDRLDDILSEPLLTTWRDRALADKQANSYREYQHQLTVRSAAIDPNDANKATVEAQVKEVAKHYQSGQLDKAQSYDDNLLVRYQLVRQGEKWLIDKAEVLKTL